MLIKSAEIFNILSIGNIKISFDDTGLKLIDGWNYDDDSANGAGKSALFNAIAFGIYGKIPRKISASEIRRRGTKKGYSRVTIEKDGDEWVVERCRPVKVTYWKNGEEQSITQAAFELELGLSYTQFLIVMYAAQIEGLKLISINDTGKKDFFLQLMHLERFSASKKETDNQIKDLKDDISSIDKIIGEAVSRIETYKEYNIDIDDINEQIENNSTADLYNTLKELQTIPKPDTSKYDELFDKIKVKQDDVERELYRVRQLQRSASTMESWLKEDETITCPSCNDELILDKDGNPCTRKEWTERISSSIENIRSDIAKAKYTHEDESKLKKVKRDLAEKKTKEQSDYNDVKVKIADIKRVISNREHTIKSLQVKLDSHNDTQAKIAKYEALKDKAEIELNEKKTELELLETISNIMSSTGAPAYIMDSVVDMFNDKMAKYVDMIWPNATYTLQTFKETKSGDMRAKFSENLNIGGTSVSVGSLSGGEYRCMSLAMDFAVINVLETMFSKKVNPVILDEPFNDLDASNRERVVDLLEKIATNRNIVVVDHASEAKSMFSDVTKIVKRNGVSSLV